MLPQRLILQKLEWCGSCGYPMVKKTLSICLAVLTEYIGVWQTDRHLATA